MLGYPKLFPEDQLIEIGDHPRSSPSFLDKPTRYILLTVIPYLTPVYYQVNITTKHINQPI